MTLPPFERVVDSYGPMVLRVCRAVVGPQDADDAWSETFLAALRAYPDLGPGANVEAWLVTIAHRKAIDQHRARSRRPIPVGEVHDALQHTDPLDATEATQAAAPTKGPDVLAALAELPDKQRFAVAYHHVAGLPYLEVAEIVGGSAEAARKAASDGVATLRRRLDPSPRAGGARATRPPPAATSTPGEDR